MFASLALLLPNPFFIEQAIPFHYYINFVAFFIYSLIYFAINVVHYCFTIVNFLQYLSIRFSKFVVIVIANFKTESLHSSTQQNVTFFTP